MVVLTSSKGRAFCCFFGIFKNCEQPGVGSLQHLPGCPSQRRPWLEPHILPFEEDKWSSTTRKVRTQTCNMTPVLFAMPCTSSSTTGGEPFRIILCCRDALNYLSNRYKSPLDCLVKLYVLAIANQLIWWSRANAAETPGHSHSAVRGS